MSVSHFLLMRRQLAQLLSTKTSSHLTLRWRQVMLDASNHWLDCVKVCASSTDQPERVRVPLVLGALTLGVFAFGMM